VSEVTLGFWCPPAQSRRETLLVSPQTMKSSSGIVRMHLPLNILHSNCKAFPYVSYHTPFLAPLSTISITLVTLSRMPPLPDATLFSTTYLSNQSYRTFSSKNRVVVLPCTHSSNQHIELTQCSTLTQQLAAISCSSRRVDVKNRR
jgi:hypothetical protein